MSKPLRKQRVPRTSLKELTEEEKKAHHNKLDREREEEKRAERFADMQARRQRLVKMGVAAIKDEEEAHILPAAIQQARQEVYDEQYRRRRQRQLDEFLNETKADIKHELQAGVPETPPRQQLAGSVPDFLTGEAQGTAAPVLALPSSGSAHDNLNESTGGAGSIFFMQG